MLTSSWGCLFSSQMVQSSLLPQDYHASLQEGVLCPCMLLVVILQQVSMIIGQFSQEHTELRFVVDCRDVLSFCCVRFRVETE